MNNLHPKQRVTTALLLAAGTGSRLLPLTKSAPKCMTMVNGKSILKRQVSVLNQQGFKRLVIVTGHLEDRIRNFLGKKAGGIKIEYVFSPRYKTTNNIYSLWMARNVIQEPFLLLESDLVFEKSLLDPMLSPNKIAVAKMKPWMNGTSVTINPARKVKAFLVGGTDSPGETRYKTINIYSLSLPSWQGIVKRLDDYISAGLSNAYYETVFGAMIADGSLAFDAVSFDGKPWYEIDTLKDLEAAMKLFAFDRYPTRKAEPRSNPVYAG
ncbi:MAG: phosphocholine cytidylyltransferase family protein [Anaerolineales bacterium]|nr:phosphocholine cytidylyltransferase family protein [Anaerolineales bacterium]